MPDDDNKKARQPGGEAVHYRFRVVTGDGRELVSQIANVRRPPAPAGLADVPVRRILVGLHGKAQGELATSPAFKDAPGKGKHQLEALEADLRAGGALVLTLALGPATPQLYQALAHHETLTTALLDLYGTDDGGAQALAHSLTLANATVASIELQPDGGAPPGQAPSLRARVVFAYESIAWTHAPQ